jgi:hypothetical protein
MKRLMPNLKLPSITTLPPLLTPPRPSTQAVDRLACPLLGRLGDYNPQLHAWWHLWTALALYNVGVLVDWYCLDGRGKLVVMAWTLGSVTPARRKAG